VSEFFNKLRNVYKHQIGYEFTNRKGTISCKENRKGFKCEIEDNEKALVIILDGNFKGSCGNFKSRKLSNSKETTCDGLIYFENENKRNCIFFELKGVNIEDAIKQIISSIKDFQNRYKKENYKYKVGAIIVGSSVSPSKTKNKELKNLIDLKPEFIRSVSKKGGQIDATSYIKR
jgi:hypothetical protein